MDLAANDQSFHRFEVQRSDHCSAIHRIRDAIQGSPPRTLRTHLNPPSGALQLDVSVNITLQSRERRDRDPLAVSPSV